MNTAASKRETIAAAGLRRIRQPQERAWGPKDAATWADASGRYRLRHVRRAWGIELAPPVWHVLKLRRAPDGQLWLQLIGRHFSLTAALRTLRAAQRGDRP
ncbi:MAG: hypothetical protein K2Y37_14670 [Pirellulales bacterium]|nr:hypothetical protein [Pirellulales bacterium]